MVDGGEWANFIQTSPKATLARLAELADPRLQERGGAAGGV